jgi:hypothetical protein
LLRISGKSTNTRRKEMKGNKNYKGKKCNEENEMQRKYETGGKKI